MNDRAWGTLAAVALLAGCGASAPTPANDAGIIVPTDTGALCANHVPDPDHNASDPAFGTLVGRSFADFTLNDCNGTPREFYGDGYCSASTRFTVISIAAGWCHPCQMESSQLTDAIVNVYGPRGVRVIQIVVQDANYQPPGGAFCNAWASMYNLTVSPNASGVGNYELMDPGQITNQYFPDNALPSTLIIDSQGIIRFHEDGASTGLASLTTELDALLSH